MATILSGQSPNHLPDPSSGPDPPADSVPPVSSAAPTIPAPPATGPDEPPPYEARTETAALDPDEILPPTTFVIHGRFIYPLIPSSSSSAGAAEPDSVPVYELSRVIHVPEQAAEAIDFSRIDPRVRTDADGSPTITTRAKLMYTMRYRRTLFYGNVPFSAWLEPHSRKSLGRVEIEKSPLFHRGYRALPVMSEAERRGRQKRGLEVPEYFFCVREQGITNKQWEWCDKKGKVVARQIRERNPEPQQRADDAEQREATGTKAQEVYKLEIVQPMSRCDRDGLVALWCLWMLHIHINECRPRKTWEDRKRILQQSGRYNHDVRGIYG
ncbi:hypothetical protein VTJ04DRAFT_4271 [Mycothermus thermophilus]|uniref:uncharacterized protein n=1 Tax=Humicola insolens TaxID=85995 RepID=UPI003742B65B